MVFVSLLFIERRKAHGVRIRMPFITFLKFSQMQNYTLLLTSTSNVKETSKEAFNELLTSGHFKNRRQQILYWLGETLKPLTRRELAKLMGIETGAISHPIKQLLEQGEIIQCPKKKNKDTRKVAESFTLKIDSDEQG